MENTQRTMLKTGLLHAIRELLYSKVRADFMEKAAGIQTWKLWGEWGSDVPGGEGACWGCGGW